MSWVSAWPHNVTLQTINRTRRHSVASWLVSSRLPVRVSVWPLSRVPRSMESKAGEPPTDIVIIIHRMCSYWSQLHLTVDCNDGNLSCYLTVGARRWFEARNNCTAQNADLAILTNNIYHQLKDRGVIKKNRDYYIGLRRVSVQWKGPGAGMNFGIFCSLMIDTLIQ